MSSASATALCSSCHRAVASSTAVSALGHANSPFFDARPRAAIFWGQNLCGKRWPGTAPAAFRRRRCNQGPNFSSGRFNCSLDRENGEGFGKDWNRLRKVGTKDGESSRKQRVSASESRRNFLGVEEGEVDPEDEKIRLPIVGDVPLTRRELRVFTPMKIFVWVVLITCAYGIWSAALSITVFSPAFWNYSSWILVKWPWPTAIALGVGTLVTAFRVSKRQPKEWEQVLLLVGALTWLILVPSGLSHGFVDGWPLILFALYVGFFLISAVVRYRLYGDLESKDRDKQWETAPSRLWQVAFIVCVVGGHWLAAFEGPFLPDVWNLQWKTILTIVTLVVSVALHYYSTYFLGKYFDRLVKPQTVVMFGPYRIIRHPIYASYMLLFAGYCMAFRSYKSLLFLLTACLAYYEQRTRLEEDLLVDTFGDLYETYRQRVANKYFPLLY